MQYRTRGTCSTQIEFDLDDDIIRNVTFTGGCNGNLKGISRLVEGRPAAEVAELLKGTTCGFKNTSCPDQLARALSEAITQN
uniref:TIGR03905 family TSCPD domain-containing protein n=1 Tax=Eubacterium cellulosolvens TaxID=29322 RepID=UPI0031017C86